MMRYREKIKYTKWVTIALLMLLAIASCRKDDDVVMPTVQETNEKVVTEYVGMYVLCEGNMGANKATLDYFDLHDGRYYQNIFPSRNPNQVKELGDVGNDCKIYGSKLWLVINCSNKVEVCSADSARSLGHVDVPNCRYLAFHEGYAYVSSFVGKVGGTSVLGSVYKIDTLSLEIKGQVSVGYQPEEMAVVDGKLYVANSGGYSAMQGKGYDKRISVIDLKTFQQESMIDVGPNLFRLRADQYGQLWATTHGDHISTPARLYLLTKDSQTGAMAVAKTFDTPVTDIAFRGDSLCFIGVDDTHEEADYYYSGVIDIKSHALVSEKLIDNLDDIETAYGLMVHPVTGDIYVMDATNYVSNGWLFCYDAKGKFKWKTSTGDIPGHACWRELRIKN